MFASGADLQGSSYGQSNYLKSCASKCRRRRAPAALLFWTHFKPYKEKNIFMQG